MTVQIEYNELREVEADINVRYYQDDILIWCNHLETHTAVIDAEYADDGIGDVITWKEFYEVCNKCNSRRLLSESHDLEWESAE